MRRSFRLIALLAAVSFSPLSGLHSTCEAAIDIKAPEPTDEPAPGSTVEFNIEVNIDDPPDGADYAQMQIALLDSDNDIIFMAEDLP